MSTPFKDQSTYMDDLSIKAMRNKYGLSQSDLAARLGVTRYTIARWEETPAFVSRLVQLAIERVKDQLNMDKYNKEEAEAAAKRKATP